MGLSFERHGARGRVTTAVLALMFVLGGVLFATPAWAHGTGETEEGYLLVQQALGHLAHDTTSTGIDLAMEKVDDALKTKDQDGVNIVEVTQAKAALEAGDVVQGRALLQHSISEAVSKLMAATGEETGTKVVLSAQNGRGRFALAGWLTLVVSVLLVAVGAWVAWRFRPTDTVGDLRRTLVTSAKTISTDDAGPTSEDAS